MDSLIPGISQPSITPNKQEQGLSAEISNLKEELLFNLKVGQSYLIDNITFDNKNYMISGKINIANLQENIDILLKQNINLSAEQIQDIQLKISQISDGSVKVNIQKINNESLNKYILQNRDNVADINNSSVIISKSSSLEAQKFIEMPIYQILRQVFAKENLSTQVNKILEENFQHSKISVEIEQFVNNKTSSLEKLFPQFEKTVENSISRIGLIIKKIAQETRQSETNLSNLKENIAQLRQEILQWKNMPLPAQAYSKPDSKLLALRSFIGNFLPESVLRVENNAKILLKVSEIIFPEEELEIYADKLMASQRLVEHLPKFSQIMKLMFMNNQQVENIEDIFKSISPLNSERGDKLAQKIIQKFPTDNEQMLSNMLKFIKAGNEKNIDLWLGKEIMSELQNFGREGLEVGQKLTEFFQNSIKETSQWKIVDIPFLSGDAINRIRLAIKNFKNEENKSSQNKKKQSARFVVDTSFSQLGNFQFDGFTFNKERHFDLIIRTNQDIPQDLKKNIFAIFKNTLHQLEYKGTIKINIKENFIKIYENEQKEDVLKQGLYI